MSTFLYSPWAWHKKLGNSWLWVALVTVKCLALYLPESRKAKLLQTHKQTHYYLLLKPNVWWSGPRSSCAFCHITRLSLHENQETYDKRKHLLPVLRSGIRVPEALPGHRGRLGTTLDTAHPSFKFRVHTPAFLKPSTLLCALLIWSPSALWFYTAEFNTNCSTNKGKLEWSANIITRVNRSI